MFFPKLFQTLDTYRRVVPFRRDGINVIFNALLVRFHCTSAKSDKYACCPVCPAHALSERPAADLAVGCASALRKPG